MIQPTALNFVIVALFIVLFAFFWRMASGALVSRNPDSPIGNAMGAIFS